MIVLVGRRLFFSFSECDDMAGSKQLEKCFFKEIYSCGSGKLIQSSQIDAIFSASEIRQDEIRLRP